MKTAPILSVLLAALLAAGVLAGSVLAEGAHHHGHDAHAVPGDTPATAAFRAVDARMHREMNIRYTNDVDVDFARAMIPHHRGAIAMARIALDHSKDPEIRRLAEDIVRAQDGEIAQMEAILKRKAAAKAP